MFVWDPRENAPYLIASENINRCKLKVPRNARICASRVVEYVLQYDEQLSPRNFVPAERLTPVSTALPADPLPDEASRYSPSFAGEDVARLAEVAEADDPKDAAASSSPHASVPEGAAPSTPPHPLDDKLLVELGDGIPIKDEVLKKEATSLEHLLTYYPKVHIAHYAILLRILQCGSLMLRMVSPIIRLILQNNLLSNWPLMMLSLQKGLSTLVRG